MTRSLMDLNPASFKEDLVAGPMSFKVSISNIPSLPLSDKLYIR